MTSSRMTSLNGTLKSLLTSRSPSLKLFPMSCLCFPSNWCESFAFSLKYKIVADWLMLSFFYSISDYTSNLFKENKIDVLTKTMVKEVKEKAIVAQDEHKNLIESVLSLWHSLQLLPYWPQTFIPFFQHSLRPSCLGNRKHSSSSSQIYDSTDWRQIPNSTKRFGRWW